MSVLIPEPDLPTDLTAEGAVEAAYAETLAEVALQINVPRWQGVPFVLRSGKAIGTARKDVTISFRAPEHLPAGFTGDTPPRSLRIDMRADVVELQLLLGDPDDPIASAAPRTSPSRNAPRVAASSSSKRTASTPASLMAYPSAEPTIELSPSAARRRAM